MGSYLKLCCAWHSSAPACFILSYLILFYFILLYLNLSYFILSYLVSICFIAWQPIREIFLSKILDGQRDKQKDPTVYRVVLQLKRLQVYKPIVYDKLSGYPVVLEWDVIYIYIEVRRWPWPCIAMLLKLQFTPHLSKHLEGLKQYWSLIWALRYRVFQNQ